MSATKNIESRGKGFLESTAKHLGFNPSSGLQLHLGRGPTKWFGIPIEITAKLLAPLDFSSPLCYQSIEMKGNNRGYRGRVFQICENTLCEVDKGYERYSGVLKFKNDEEKQFVSNISKLKEKVQYELYAGGLDSRPTTGTVIRIVEIQEVSES